MTWSTNDALLVLLARNEAWSKYTPKSTFPGSLCTKAIVMSLVICVD